MAPVPPGLDGVRLSNPAASGEGYPFMFRGRRVDPHSSFGKGFGPRLTMDVWSRLTGDPREPGATEMKLSLTPFRANGWA